MALPNYFVDPSIDANSGSGTVGDPYGDLQYALDTITKGSGGDRINIKAGTAEVLTGSIDLTTYGTPSDSAPLVFQGYTSAALDGGIGDIDGDATYSILNNSALDGVSFVDLKLHNTGSNVILRLDNDCCLVNCEFYDCGGGTAVRLDNDSVIYNCHFHDIENSGSYVQTSNSRIEGCYLDLAGTTATRGIFHYGHAMRNIIVIDGSQVGIYLNNGHAIHNSILATSTTSSRGIDCKYNTPGLHSNLIEGATLGIAFHSDTGFYGLNACYNNGTNYSGSTDIQHDLGDNESLSASPFAKSGALTFANRATYFAPVNTGNVIGGGLHGFDKGAIQSVAGGGSTTTIIKRLRRVM